MIHKNYESLKKTLKNSKYIKIKGKLDVSIKDNLFLKRNIIFIG